MNERRSEKSAGGHLFSVRAGFVGAETLVEPSV
jgi:hypothetical protein